MHNTKKRYKIYPNIWRS